MRGTAFVRSTADLQPWLTGARRTLAGIWYWSHALEQVPPDELSAALGWPLPVGFVRFAVSEAIRAASEPLVTRSAGGGLPDPSPDSPATGTGFLTVRVEVVELLSGLVPLPPGAEVGVVEPDGRWRLLGAVGSGGAR